jgi:hypothetical protein
MWRESLAVFERLGESRAIAVARQRLAWLQTRNG